jgi:excisionase family DNA binding protein
MKLLTTAEAASIIGVAERTLRRWSNNKEGPPFTQIGGRRFYDRAEVEEWRRAQRVETEER